MSKPDVYQALSIARLRSLDHLNMQVADIDVAEMLRGSISPEEERQREALLAEIKAVEALIIEAGHEFLLHDDPTDGRAPSDTYWRA